jgi:hypothetical protein
MSQRHDLKLETVTRAKALTETWRKSAGPIECEIGSSMLPTPYAIIPLDGAEWLSNTVGFAITSGQW